MKKILFTILIIASVSLCSAQKIRPGIKAGMNFSRLTESTDTKKFNTVGGFQVGVLAEYFFNDFLAVQPEFYYMQCGLNTDAIDMATVPLHIKFAFNNGKPLRFHALAGPDFSYIISNPATIDYTIEIAASVGLGLEYKTFTFDLGFKKGFNGGDYKPGIGSSKSIKLNMFTVSIGKFF